ncbi:MAG: PilZ domain-containing protein [Mariprofundaceae bacterium]|nr:PilZ domain-containing protein [Mariprofundaceae bacterium]
MQQKKDQRKHARQLSKIDVEFSIAHSLSLQAIGTNISLGGAWLHFSDAQPAIGDVGKLHARIGDLHLYMMAKVVRKAPTGIGVSFIDMGIETYQKLNAMLQRTAEQPDWITQQNKPTYKTGRTALL